MLLYVAAQDPDEQISSADIGNAFLEADLTDPVYIEQHPEVHVEGKPHADYVCLEAEEVPIRHPSGWTRIPACLQQAYGRTWFQTTEQ